MRFFSIFIWVIPEFFYWNHIVLLNQHELSKIKSQLVWSNKSFKNVWRNKMLSCVQCILNKQKLMILFYIKYLDISDAYIHFSMLLKTFKYFFFSLFSLNELWFKNLMTIFFCFGVLFLVCFNLYWTLS